VQAEIPNHRKLRWSRAKVVSVAANGPLSAGQVCDEKTNMCEPLLTHRNGRKDGIGTGVACYPRESQASRPVTGGPTGARETPAVLTWWCPVYRWRELVAGTGMEQENLSPQYRWPVEMGLGPLAARGRTASGTNREWQSTDVGHRGGPARSSDEGPVMGLEQRGWAGQVTLRPTRLGRS